MRPTEPELKAKILTILSHHIGQENAIDMGELSNRVTGEPWGNKINHTRKLRHVITALRYEGALIGELRANTGGGYYLARTATELNAWFDRRIYEAMKKLKMVSVMREQSVPELLGQMMLNIQRTEGSGQVSEVRCQRTEGSGQRTEVGNG